MREEMGAGVAGMNAMRRPELCEHRRCVASSGVVQEVCEYVHQVLGEGPVASPAVNKSVCAACCRHALPEDGSLNPVIASLVISAVERAGQISDLEAHDQVFVHQAKQFAGRWLNTSGDGESFRASVLHGEDSVRSRIHTADPYYPPFDLAEPASRLKIGLVGQYAPGGLGHMHIDIAMHLGIDRWLIPVPPEVHDQPGGLACRIDILPQPNDAQVLEWLHGLDIVLFVERPALQRLTRLARRRGIVVACVPMWEYLQPGQEWLDDVDLMLAPTRFTARLLSQWKLRFRFPWRLETVPWPVDIHRFRFRPRYECRRFVFVNGTGGRSALKWDRSAVQFQRKGLEVLLAAARLMPEISIVVYSCNRPEDIPMNVELRPPPVDNSLLYCDADVCVQPSHWEGLGLPLLECQAAGMPLITTDAPPMNEHRPLALIPATVHPAFLRPEQYIFAARIDPSELAATMRAVHDRRIGSASRLARRFIECEHSWAVARPRILKAIADVVAIARHAEK
jgi:hypothetical protein